MRNSTRLKFNAFVSQIALLNGVPDATKQFTIAPSVQQKIVERVQLQSEFLRSINYVMVPEQEGQTVGIDITTTIAGRTNTAGGTRINPADPTDTSEVSTYRCERTEFNWARQYSAIDAWRHRSDFETKLRDAILKRQALDMIMIGWNGTSVAAQTNRVNNPLLQDVGKGWLYKIRTRAPARYLKDGALTGAGPDKIYVASGVELYNEAAANAATAKADYVNLDALVYDAIELLDEWHRDSTDLVVICGRDLVHDKYFPLINNSGDKATEQEARDRILRSEKQIGGLPAIRVPFFPANALLITSLDNLSVYEHEGSRRRRLADEPEYTRIANYDMANIDFPVEDYGKVALVENIVLAAKP
ncbi:phage major capsid protein, P2 family [Novosphingobium sp.]|uniref:phage major capsid protein, P2 family n=1 Tax=Novosphingobium sp. TaxID=1874826 RepID=UPI0038B7D809